MAILKHYILYFLRNMKNIYKIFLNHNSNNLYLPNFLIKNVIFINPNLIKYINSIPMKFYKNTRLIDDFDWDKKNKNINDHELKDYKFIICKDFNKQIKLDNSNSFINQKENLDKYEIIYNPEINNESLKNYLQNTLNLFNSINKKGLRKLFDNNIQFMIDRNSNLVKINSGDHRFVISRILNLKRIPIEVKLIHINCIKKDFDKTKLLSSVNQLIQKIEDKYN